MPQTAQIVKEIVTQHKECAPTRCFAVYTATQKPSRKNGRSVSFFSAECSRSLSRNFLGQQTICKFQRTPILSEIIKRKRHIKTKFLP